MNNRTKEITTMMANLTCNLASPEENVYEQAYDVIYDWEAIILDNELWDEDGSPDNEDEPEDLIPELWLPGNAEIGEA